MQRVISCVDDRGGDGGGVWIGRRGGLRKNKRQMRGAGPEKKKQLRAASSSGGLGSRGTRIGGAGNIKSEEAADWGKRLGGNGRWAGGLDQTREVRKKKLLTLFFSLPGVSIKESHAKEKGREEKRRG
jgi:hypothetical protein